MNSVVFDLDGTLVDSLRGIESSLRGALDKVMPGGELPSLRDFIGPPLPTMVSEMWPMLDAVEVALLVSEFRNLYSQHGWKLTVPFPGVRKTLNRLHNSGYHLFVLTNKPTRISRLILDSLGLLSFFRDVVSLDFCNPPFVSKQESARFLIREHSLDPTLTVMMGDGRDDMVSATACGFRFVAAAYGYGKAADLCENRAERFADIGLHLF
jgi:phosphoglycolate phosphatase